MNIKERLEWLEGSMTLFGLHDKFEYSDKPWYRAMNDKGVLLQGDINHYTINTDKPSDDNLLSKVPKDYHAILYPEKIEVTHIKGRGDISTPTQFMYEDDETEFHIIIHMAFIPNDFKFIKSL